MHTIEESKKGKNRKKERGRSESAPLAPEFAVVVEAWNAIPDVLHVRDLSKGRTASLKSRFNEPNWVTGWREGIAKVAESKFCRGDNNRSWKANFDWFIRPDTLTKILEGNYDDGKPGNITNRPGGNGSPNLLEREQLRENQQHDILRQFVEGDSGDNPL